MSCTEEDNSRYHLTVMTQKARLLRVWAGGGADRSRLQDRESLPSAMRGARLLWFEQESGVCVSWEWS